MAHKITMALCWLLLLGVFGACSGNPGPASVANTTVTPVGTEIPAASPAPAPTEILTPMPAASPTLTPAPAFTPAATAAETASPSVTPTATSEPPAAAQAPPAAAAGAADPLAAGRWQQVIGNCYQARRMFADLLADGLDGAAASEARFRMAQCYLRDEAYAEAWAALSELLAAATPADAYFAPAQFLLGDALTALANWPAAEAAYTAHLPLAPELAYLTHQRIAAARRGQDDLAGAAEAYRAALAVSPDWANTTAIRRALAGLALDQGNITEAVAHYDALRGGETAGAWAAEMQYLAGNALARPAQLLAQAVQLVAPATVTATATPIAVPAEALARWRAAVEADITSRWAHAAIVALLDAGETVDEYQRGRANYHNQVYALAIAAFDRLRANTGGTAASIPPDAWYYAGLSYLALQEQAQGLAELEHFIANAPGDPLWPAAWLAVGQAQSRAGQRDMAVATYRRLAELRPDAPQAAVALWRAAVLTDVEPPTPAAAEAYLALARRYPKADEGWRAYQNAGMIYFRLGDWPRAIETWEAMAAQAELPAFTRPVAHFWLGRALLASGDPQAAAQAWGQAQGADPYNFFHLRSAAWAAGAASAWVREDAPRSGQPAASAADGVGDIAAWLQGWAGAGALAAGSLPDRILADADWQRGRSLLALGLRPQALAQWERVRIRYADDPWALAALALAFRDAGAHRLSLLCAERLVVKWGRPMADAPAALQRLAYPFPYADLIRAEAAKQNLDPRLLAAVIRQESRFEGGATSVAGAQGLMQVMPGTAEGIARQLGWPDFAPRQAYLPYVNVAFGAFYVRQWLTHFDGSVFAALAAYNGGPGNATVWFNWAPDDDDLLAGLININETRVYVQAVWANYEVYRRLYP